MDDFIFSNRKCPSTSTKEQHLSHPMNAGRLDRLLSYSKAISYCNVLTSAPLVYAMTHSMCYPICHVWNREQSVAVGHTERGSLWASWAQDFLSFIDVYCQTFVFLLIYWVLYLIEEISPCSPWKMNFWSKAEPFCWLRGRSAIYWVSHMSAFHLPWFVWGPQGSAQAE